MIRNLKIKKILTIAGSDSSSGAGVQADIKTIQSLGGYCSTAITLITAQNTKKIIDIHVIPDDIVIQQVKAIDDDFGFDAIKIGALASVSIAKKIGNILKDKKIPIILDPVYKSTTGKEFSRKSDFFKIQKILINFSSMILPNIEEAEILSNISIINFNDMKEACKIIGNNTNCSVLLKGLETNNGKTLDLLYEKKRFFKFPYLKIKSNDTHGTGCSLSSAVALFLSKGNDVITSIKLSKKYIIKSIKNSPKLSKFNGPMGH